MVHPLKCRLAFAVACGALLAATAAAAPGIRYVDVTAAPGGDGQAWGSAYDDLHRALQEASGNAAITQIWVADGSYPTGGSPFMLTGAVQVYGGFAGGEQSLEQRDPAANHTLLDGAGGGSAVVAFATNTMARLDGFTVASAETTRGLSLAVSAPTVANCRVLDNRTIASGAGVRIEGGSPTFRACVFAGNVTNDRGGAVYLVSGDCSFVNCTFARNEAFNGGGFASNAGTATFVQCVWHDNQARFGGGAYSFSGTLELMSCTLTENDAVTAGGGVYTLIGAASLSNSIVYGNTANSESQIRGTATVSYCCVEGGAAGAGNIDDAPVFVDPASDDFRVRLPSRCIDAGSNLLVALDAHDLDGDGDRTERLPIDRADAPRFVDTVNAPDEGVADPPDYPFVVDMGAYEYTDDCNGNGIPDAEDLAMGSSLDCNGNGLPDDCELINNDCNANGVPDECDLGGDPLVTYALDDGGAEDSIGLNNAGDTAWLTNFVVQPDGESIGALRIAFGSVAEGTPVTAYVWSDPNGDGQPDDAQVITSAVSSVQNPDSSTFTFIEIPDTHLGPVGTSFFAGALVTHKAGELPAAVDLDQHQGAGWVAASSGGVDPNDLSAAGVYGLVNGNWLVRAVSAGATPSNDCNANSIPDDCEIAQGSPDCQPNGVPDECELAGNDCNNNLVPDECDIALGTSRDCQLDGVPDDCQLLDGSEFTYVLDDGSAETNIGFAPDVYAAWFNGFTVTEGHEQVGAIAIAYGAIAAGSPAKLYVWSDPDNDGNPADAEVLAEVETIVANPDTSILNVSTFEPVRIGPAGTRFFVGAIMRVPINNTAGALDNSLSAQQSWIVVNNAVPPDEDFPIDPNDLLRPYPGQLAGLIDNFNFPGNWLIRALEPPANDCNANAVPDECDIASGHSFDIDGNGVPDECERLIGDCNCNGTVSVGDINAFVLALTDPAGYVAAFPDCNILNADCTGDGNVSVGDINCFVELVTGS